MSAHWDTLPPAPPPLPTGTPCPAWRMVLTREGRGRGEGGMRGNWPRHPQQSVPSPLPLFGGVVDPQQCVEPAGAIAEHSASPRDPPCDAPCDSPCERPLPAGSREGGGGGVRSDAARVCWLGRTGGGACTRKTCGPPGIGRQQHGTPRAAARGKILFLIRLQMEKTCGAPGPRRGEVLSTQVEWALSDTLRPSTSEYVHAIYRAVLSDFRCSHAVHDRLFVVCIGYCVLVRDEHVSFVDLHCNYCRLTRLLGPDRTAETLVTGDSTGAETMFICSYLFSQFSIVFVMRVLFQIRLKKKLSVEAGLVGPFFSQVTW